MIEGKIMDYKLKNPIAVFEEWLENMRKDFHIIKFKEFREEMFDFVKNMENQKDISGISRIVEKYMDKNK
jgi:hypothetical protein